MRAVIQRVSEAKVTIGGNVKGAIQAGLLVLVAIEETDTAEDIEWLSNKIVRLRIFNDDDGVMNCSVQPVPAPARVGNTTSNEQRHNPALRLSCHKQTESGHCPIFILELASLLSPRYIE
jgi:hypothetical protein